MPHFELEIDSSAATNDASAPEIKLAIDSVARGEAGFFILSEASNPDSFAQTNCFGEPNEPWVFEHSVDGVLHRRWVPRGEVLQLFQNWMQRHPGWGTGPGWEADESFKKKPGLLRRLFGNR